MARSLSILTCNACRGKSCEKKLKKFPLLHPRCSCTLRAHARVPTDFAKIREASRGARAMGANQRYAGARQEIEHATSEGAAEYQHARGVHRGQARYVELKLPAGEE